MTVKMYVDWGREEIINEKEYNAYLDRSVKETLEDECWLETFLDEYIQREDYPYTKLFKLDKCEREELWRNCEALAKRHVERYSTSPKTGC